MKKDRPQLLGEFIKLLYERDPMGLYAEDNSDKENEYESEALSILSRFVEGHVAGAPRDEALALAYWIVQNAFTFWFTAPLRDEEKAKRLAEELLDLFMSAYPEQAPQPEVVSEP